MRTSIASSVLAMAATACALAPDQDATTIGSAVAARPAPFGEAIPGIRASVRAQFAAGERVFTQDHTPQTGLGPVFNQASCVSCHGFPAAGGTGTIDAVRFGRNSDSGGFDPMTDHGGATLQRLGIRSGDCEQRGEEIPAAATIVALRQTQPLFGLGYLEAVPEATLRALADPEDLDGDGISGRVNEVVDPVTGAVQVGRFGWKADTSSLVAFAADASQNELGLTNTLFPDELLPQGQPAACDDDIANAIDDADSDGDGISDGVAQMANYMRLLAVPPRGPTSEATRSGSRIFDRIGCTSCHVPQLVTGATGIPQLSRKTIRAYTDLLLHDMGALGDGVVQGDARASEFRTPPLWGLRETEPYLHNGLATNLFEAVIFHDGEARASRDAFANLDFGEQEAVLEFLGSL